MSTPKRAEENKQGQGGRKLATSLTPAAEELMKMTVYVRKSIGKAFKIFAIENDREYSEQADVAFTEYLKKHKLKA